MMLSAKEVELLSIAFDASYTHMYAQGTRRDIWGALAACASGEEIMEALKRGTVWGHPGLQSRRADPRRGNRAPTWPSRCRP